MAYARVQPAGIYHVVSRGVDRRWIFTEDDTRMLFLNLLARVVAKRGVECHAYCLMGNHFHLVLETREDGELAPAMQYLNSTYARLFNATTGRGGYLFEQPYGSFRVETEGHALELSRYVVLNPVRIGIVTCAEDYRWSSFRATIGLVTRPSFLRADFVLGHFSEDPDRARVQYALFVADGAPARSPR
jgi:putative transposase